MTLIFGIVFFILAKFGFPAITGMVDERSRRINDSIAKAKEAEKQLTELTAKQAEMIEQARVEQGRILKETGEARDRMIADAKQQAREEADKLISQARMQIAAERETALRDIRNQVAEISMEVAEKVIRKDLGTTDEQLSLISRMVDEASRTKLN